MGFIISAIPLLNLVRLASFLPRTLPAASHSSRCRSRCAGRQFIEGHAERASQSSRNRQRGFTFVLFQLRQVTLRDPGRRRKLDLGLVSRFACSPELLAQRGNTRTIRYGLAPSGQLSADSRVAPASPARSARGLRRTRRPLQRSIDGLGSYVPCFGLLGRHRGAHSPVCI